MPFNLISVFLSDSKYSKKPLPETILNEANYAKNLAAGVLFDEMKTF